MSAPDRAAVEAAVAHVRQVHTWRAERGYATHDYGDDAIAMLLDEVERLGRVEQERAGVVPDPEPIGGWILWGPTGRWMASTTWATDEHRRDDGWRSVSINDAEAQEFRSKGCFLDALDRVGWRAFKELSGFLDVRDGSREQWLAKRADLAARDEREAPGAELFSDECDCDCQPGQPCLCPERDCYCGPCRVCDRDENDGTGQ